MNVNGNAESALTSLVALLRLIDDVDAALASDHAVVSMPGLQRPKRVLDLHGKGPAHVCVRLKRVSRQIGNRVMDCQDRGVRPRLGRDVPEAIAGRRTSPLLHLQHPTP